MMSPDTPGAQNFGTSNSIYGDWWLVKWSSWLATIGAIFLAFSGVMTAAFSTVSLSPTCVVSGILQIFAAGLILAIEGSTIVAFLTFAKPVGKLFENRPVWLKTAVYAALTIFPMILGCGGFWITLGFIDSAAITALYGMLLIGRKAELDDMRIAATIPA